MGSGLPELSWLGGVSSGHSHTPEAQLDELTGSVRRDVHGAWPVASTDVTPPASADSAGVNLPKGLFKKSH